MDKIVTWNIVISFHHVFAFFGLVVVTFLSAFLRSEQIALLGIPAVFTFYMNKHYQQRKERENGTD